MAASSGGGRRSRGRTVSLLITLLVVLVALAWSALRPAELPPAAVVPTPTSAPSRQATIDPVSGLAWIDLDDLPAQAADTLILIAEGPPYPYRADGETFGNREGLLPEESHGYYREFTVETPGSPDRGARRIVVGADGEYYWTDDHYASFRRIRS
ncbi:MAG: ribonuclease domain-containing protein [Propioniciclava sp.]